jgi:trk system potassium uptake protein TrkH
LLLLAGGMPLFDALCNTFGTAGTGGFCIWNDSIAHYHSAYADMVIGVFMLLFSLNFNLYFLLLLRQFRPVFKNSELRWFLSIVAVATAAVMIDVRHLYPGFFTNFRYSFFQVISVTSTTGFATADFNQWPILSKTVLVLLMFMGACAGSTGGGVKVSRFMILWKSIVREVQSYIHPKIVKKVTMDNKAVEPDVLKSTHVFISTYAVIFLASMFLVSLNNLDMTTTFTSVLATLNNIGPGLSMVGATCNYGFLSGLSKWVFVS